jgi:hypothetical protein
MKHKQVLAASALLIWTTLVLGVYFTVHKPWPLVVRSAPVIMLIDLLLGLALIGLAGGLGGRVLSSLSTLDPLERFALRLAMGVGILGLGTLVLGMFGALAPWIGWVVLGVGLIWLRRSTWAWALDLRSVPEWFHRTTRFGRILACLIAVLVLLGLLRALAPPIKWDALVYHLDIPKRYLAAGSVFISGDNPFLGMPQIAEMMYTWAMALRGGPTAAVFGWAVGVAALIGIIGFAGKLFGPRVAWIAPAALLSGASLARSLGWAYVDMWLVLFGLGMIVALEEFARTQKPSWLLCTGLLAGFGMLTKYSGMAILIAGLVSILGLMKSWKQALKWMAYIAGPALAVASVWLIKNLIHFGNPFYPFFFPTEAMSAVRQAFLSGPAPQRSLLADLFLPWGATMTGVEGGPGYAASIGPLYLALIPGLAVGWRTVEQQARRSLSLMLRFALTGWAVWALGSHVSGTLSQARLYWGFFPALAVLAGAGFEGAAGIRIASVRVGRVLGALVILTFGLVTLGELAHFTSTNPLSVLTGSRSETDYLAANLGWFEPAMGAINELPSDADVLFLWEARGFYCQVKCRPDTIIDRWYTARRMIGGPQAILSAWSRSGVTHILLYQTGMRFVRETDMRYDPDDWQNLTDFLAGLTPVQVFGDAYSLYTVTP